MSTLKRKAADESSTSLSKKRNIEGTTSSIRTAFRSDLFDEPIVNSYRAGYDKSGPYPHAVVSSLIQDGLLRRVRSEISEHISFTLKETDIYRIHQSGDLANLSKLDAESLKHLPSLVRLRDALYSPDFREWVSHVTGAGKLSGQKTDMAVNVYTPGSYLLCHDDVIGSRRVSYILYLTDPDKPWQPEWGGGLRLYPTKVRKNKDGEDIKVPLPEHTLNIPPSFGQLSFFTVLPGESYHDVEEVYHSTSPQDSSTEDGGRIRMAISGWFHIPQSGEDGYEAGLEQSQAQRSSLTQLKGAANEFDEPQAMFRHYDEARTVMNSSATETELDPGDDADIDDDILTEQDLTFLLQYISPSFLTPDMIEQFADSFTNTSLLQLQSFFSQKFAAELKAFIQSEDSSTSKGDWPVARPPHKHRFAYLQSSEALHSSSSPIARVLTDLLHSHAFKKWLALITGLPAKSLVRQDALARRFRKGKDYALASPYTGKQPRLEYTIGMTPSEGWERDAVDQDEATAPAEENGESSSKSKTTNGHINGKPDGEASAAGDIQVETTALPEYGGEEVYMAGDDEDAEPAQANGGADLPSVGKKAAHDPAVYKAGDDEDEDGGILFTDSPAWNTFSVVLRDRGTLRFVKYVSQAAKGDRWDVKGAVELGDGAFDGEDDEEAADEEEDEVDEAEEGDEEEFDEGEDDN
jgi:prolyl 3-hydroxylase /prolyl 3,4-dihydroxylase